MNPRERAQEIRAVLVRGREPGERVDRSHRDDVCRLFVSANLDGEGRGLSGAQAQSVTGLDRHRVRGARWNGQDQVPPRYERSPIAVEVFDTHAGGADRDTAVLR